MLSLSEVQISFIHKYEYSGNFSIPQVHHWHQYKYSGNFSIPLVHHWHQYDDNHFQHMLSQQAHQKIDTTQNKILSQNYEFKKHTLKYQGNENHLNIVKDYHWKLAC